MWSPVRIAVMLLAAVILAACAMGIIGAATCYRLGRIPCEMPGLQQFAGDALAALLGMIAGRTGRD